MSKHCLEQNALSLV